MGTNHIPGTQVHISGTPHFFGGQRTRGPLRPPNFSLLPLRLQKLSIPSEDLANDYNGASNHLSSSQSSGSHSGVLSTGSGIDQVAHERSSSSSSSESVMSILVDSPQPSPQSSSRATVDEIIEAPTAGDNNGASSSSETSKESQLGNSKITSALGDNTISPGGNINSTGDNNNTSLENNNNNTSSRNNNTASEVQNIASSDTGNNNTSPGDSNTNSGVDNEEHEPVSGQH